MKTSNNKRTRDFFEAACEILGDEKVDRAVQKGKEMKRKFEIKVLYSIESDLSSSNIADRIKREFSRDIDEIHFEEVRYCTDDPSFIRMYDGLDSVSEQDLKIMTLELRLKAMKDKNQQLKIDLKSAYEILGEQVVKEKGLKRITSTEPDNPDRLIVDPATFVEKAISRYPDIDSGENNEQEPQPKKAIRRYTCDEIEELLSSLAIDDVIITYGALGGKIATSKVINIIDGAIIVGFYNHDCSTFQDYGSFRPTGLSGHSWTVNE